MSGMKVSLHIEKAKDTAAHNDRDMYPSGESPSEFAKDGHPPNRYWHSGDQSKNFAAAEDEVYEKLVRRRVKEIEDNKKKNGQKKRMYKDHAEAVAKFKEQHPVYEMIIQLGGLENPVDDDRFVQGVWHAILNEGLLGDRIQVLNMALHNDEATPHLQIRFVGLDENDLPNLSGALRVMGVPETELEPEEKQRLFDDAKRFGRDEKQVAASIKRKTNRRVTWTRDLREFLEDYAVDLGYEIDTTRSRKRNKKLSDFKADKARERRDAKQAELIQKSNEAAEKLDDERAQIEAKIEALNDEDPEVAKLRDTYEQMKVSKSQKDQQAVQDLNEQIKNLERVPSEITLKQNKIQDLKTYWKQVEDALDLEVERLVDPPESVIEKEKQIDLYHEAWDEYEEDLDERLVEAKQERDGLVSRQAELAETVEEIDRIVLEIQECGLQGRTEKEIDDLAGKAKVKSTVAVRLKKAKRNSGTDFKPNQGLYR